MEHKEVPLLKAWLVLLLTQTHVGNNAYGHAFIGKFSSCIVCQMSSLWETHESRYHKSPICLLKTLCVQLMRKSWVLRHLTPHLMLFIVIVIVVNSYQGGWFDFHVDCIVVHIISKGLEKDWLKKKFWKMDYFIKIKKYIKIIFFAKNLSCNLLIKIKGEINFFIL